MIIPLFLGLGGIVLIGCCLMAVVYLPYSIYEDKQNSKSPIVMEHAQYMGCSFSEDYKTTTLKIGGENYSVPYEIFSNVKNGCKGRDVGYLIHQRKKFYGFIFKKDYLIKIDHVLSLTWNNKYTVIDSESNPIMVSEVGAFLGEFYTHHKENQVFCNFIFYNGKEYIVLEKIEKLEGQRIFIPSEFKFNENIGTFVRVIYKGKKLIDCEKLSRYETDLIEGKINGE